MSVYAVLGVVAGIVAFAANPPYIWAILKGQTKPDRVTWWILAGLNILILASSHSLGAWNTLWLPLGYAVSFGSIAILSIKYGEGDFRLTALQWVCIISAIATAFLWWRTGDPLIALMLTIAIDFLALIPTIYKSYLRPWHEDKIAWSIAFFASILYLFAVDPWSLSMAAYPVYVFTTNAILVALIVLPFRRVTA